MPAWRWTRIVAAYLTPTALALVYVGLMLMRAEPNGGGFGSIDQLNRMFQNPWLLLAGWIHYSMFDLFIAAWEVRDSQRLGIKHGFVVPCLILTYVVGPAGLLAYFAVRALIVRRWPGLEAPARPGPGRQSMPPPRPSPTPRLSPTTRPSDPARPESPPVRR